jgi:hypothetical protein
LGSKASNVFGSTLGFADDFPSLCHCDAAAPRLLPASSAQDTLLPSHCTAMQPDVQRNTFAQMLIKRARLPIALPWRRPSAALLF